MKTNLAGTLLDTLKCTYNSVSIKINESEYVGPFKEHIVFLLFYSSSHGPCGM